MAAGHFLLLAQKKVTKEKGTLAAAVAGASMPLRLREQAPGSAHGTSMCRDRTRGHPARARATRGYFLRLLAAAERGPGRAKSAAVPAAEAPDISDRPSLALLCFCSWVPSKAVAEGGRTSRVPRTRAARGIAPIRTTGHGWPVGRTRPPVANPRRRRGHGAEGAVFFGYFLLGKQKKVTGDHGWSTKSTRT